MDVLTAMTRVTCQDVERLLTRVGRAHTLGAVWDLLSPPLCAIIYPIDFEVTVVQKVLESPFSTPPLEMTLANLIASIAALLDATLLLLLQTFLSAVSADGTTPPSF
jgi:hypothetical protein